MSGDMLCAAGSPAVAGYHPNGYIPLVIDGVPVSTGEVVHSFTEGELPNSLLFKNSKARYFVRRGRFPKTNVTHVKPSDDALLRVFPSGVDVHNVSDPDAFVSGNTYTYKGPWFAEGRRGYSNYGTGCDQVTRLYLRGSTSTGMTFTYVLWYWREYYLNSDGSKGSDIFTSEPWSFRGGAFIDSPAKGLIFAPFVGGPYPSTAAGRQADRPTFTTNWWGNWQTCVGTIDAMGTPGAGGGSSYVFPERWDGGSVTRLTVPQWTESTVNSILKAIGHAFNDGLASLDDSASQFAADHFDEALQNYAGPNMSWLEFLIPLKEVPASLRAMGVIPKTIREAAGYYLNYLYGVKTLPSDALDFYDTLSGLMRRVIQDTSGWIHLKARGSLQGENLSGVWYASCLGTCANRAAMAAAHLGIADPITEIWNCIPYSFVIDWFTGLGDVFARAENAWLWRALELSEICWSYKVSVQLSALLPSLPRNVQVSGSASVYKRSYLDALPERLWYQPPDAIANARRHWAELACLLIQQAP